MSTRRALVIGASQYEDPTLAQLKAPETDVRALAALLGDAAIGQFDEVRTILDEAEAATRRAIASFYAQSRSDDLLLLYFSGHGILDDQGRLYLAVRDTLHELPQGTALSAAFITDGMDTSRSRRQVLILDCCHSGAFARGARAATGARAITQATFEGIGYGRAVITATDATQYAWEGEAVRGSAEHSVFTAHLIEGLRTGAADGDGDGEITLDELYDYVYTQVVKQTPRQTPRKWSYNQEGTLLIARTTPAPRARALPTELQQSLEDGRTWVRAGAVQELVRLLDVQAQGMALTARETLVRIAEHDDSLTVRAIARRALDSGAPGVPLPGSLPEQPADPPGPDAASTETATAPLVRSRLQQNAGGAEASTGDSSSLARAGSASATGGWRPVALLAAGWGLAFYFGSVAFWQIYLNGTELYPSRIIELILVGLIGGSATAFSLRLGPRSSAGASDTTLVIIVGWLLTALLGLLVFPLLAEGGTTIDAAFAWERAAIGAVGGIWLSALLYRQRWLSADRAMTTALVWASAWALASLLLFNLIRAAYGDNLSDALQNQLTAALDDSVAGALFPWADAAFRGLYGALGGLSAGWLLMRQLRLDADRAS